MNTLQTIALIYFVGVWVTTLTIYTFSTFKPDKWIDFSGALFLGLFWWILCIWLVVPYFARAGVQLSTYLSKRIDSRAALIRVNRYLTDPKNWVVTVGGGRYDAKTGATFIPAGKSFHMWKQAIENGFIICSTQKHKTDWLDSFYVY